MKNTREVGVETNLGGREMTTEISLVTVETTEIEEHGEMIMR